MNNRTPEGDGNLNQFKPTQTAFTRVMNNRTPEGDGNHNAVDRVDHNDLGYE